MKPIKNTYIMFETEMEDLYIVHENVSIYIDLATLMQFTYTWRVNLKTTTI